MLKKARLTLPGLMFAIGLTATPANTITPYPGAETFGVGMVDFAFEPADLTVRPGDVIRFTQKGIQPHNVEFRRVPRGVDLGGTRMGPFLVKKDDVYELRIDARFKPGIYEFVCTPHELMGMKGRFTVLGDR